MELKIWTGGQSLLRDSKVFIEPESCSHSQASTHDWMGHIWLIDIMKIQTTP